MEDFAGEQSLLTSNIFHTNPSNFPKIQAAINTHSSMLVGSKLSTFIFLSSFFHFWHLFSTTTVFDDCQSHAIMSCKETVTQCYICFLPFSLFVYLFLID